jgi:hypothetical protein
VAEAALQERLLAKLRPGARAGRVPAQQVAAADAASADDDLAEVNRHRHEHQQRVRRQTGPQEAIVEIIEHFALGERRGGRDERVKHIPRLLAGRRESGGGVVADAVHPERLTGAAVDGVEQQLQLVVPVVEVEDDSAHAMGGRLRIELEELVVVRRRTPSFAVVRAEEARLCATVNRLLLPWPIIDRPIRERNPLAAASALSMLVLAVAARSVRLLRAVS